MKPTNEEIKQDILDDEKRELANEMLAVAEDVWTDDNLDDLRKEYCREQYNEYEESK